jgi:hypothetical protein
MRLNLEIRNLEGNKDAHFNLPISENQSRRVKEYFSSHGILERNDIDANTNNLIINLSKDDSLTGANSTYVLEILYKAFKGV